MIGLLEGNLPGRALAGTSAALLAVLLLLGVAWMLPPSGSAQAVEADAGALSNEVPQLIEPQPIERYAEIVDRPVFNETRQPVIGADLMDGEEDELTVAEDVDAPEVELAGIVITPELRLATLRLKGGEESLVALEGEPLKGDFGSWRVSRVEPRSAVLESASGDQVELKLQVHDAIIDAPPEPEPKPTPTNRLADSAGENGAGEEADRPLSRAEEIRQRIAERREELRRAQEEGGEPPEAPTADYRQAIQNMIQGRRQETQENDENEQ
jgi:hypothetical protein